MKRDRDYVRIRLCKNSVGPVSPLKRTGMLGADTINGGRSNLNLRTQGNTRLDWQSYERGTGVVRQDQQDEA